MSDKRNKQIFKFFEVEKFMKNPLTPYIFAGIYDEVKNNPKGHTRTKTPDWNEFHPIELGQVRKSICQRIGTAITLILVALGGILIFSVLSDNETMLKLIISIGIIAIGLAFMSLVCLVELLKTANKEVELKK